VIGFALYFLYGYKHSRLRRPLAASLDSDGADPATPSS